MFTAPSRTTRLLAHDIGVRISNFDILNGISLSVAAGEVLGVIGPNGSGKSTLLRTLAGVLTPTSGNVLLDGKALDALPARARAQKIAFMPQFAGHHPFTAMESVLMGRYPHLDRFGIEDAEDRRIALHALQRTGTLEFAGRHIDSLSGGERQRVLLARCLAQQAAALLLDEPTSALDLKHRLLTMETVRQEAATGAAAVLAMHDLSLAGQFCDRLMLLKDGNVLASGTPSEVLIPGLIRDAFEVEVVVEPDSVTGRPQVTVLGSAGRSSGVIGKGTTVHLICGAGSGRDFMYQLATAGFTVTACVLGKGDTDRETAERLNIEFVPAAAFAPINDSQHAHHLELIRSADWTVLCDMAIGPNNLPNLLAARDARRLLIVEGAPFDELDYTGGDASSVFAGLASAGTATAVRPVDVLRTLARAAGQAAT